MENSGWGAERWGVWEVWGGVGGGGMKLKVHLAPCVHYYCHFGLPPLLHLRL